MWCYQNKNISTCTALLSNGSTHEDKYVQDTVQFMFSASTVLHVVLVCFELKVDISMFIMGDA